MITAWQFASLPIWAFGLFFLIVALPLGCGWGRKPHETSADLGQQMVTGIVVGTVMLIIAAWMWSGR